MNKVRFVHQAGSQSILDVMFNDVKLGEAYPLDCGFYHYETAIGLGVLSASTLREIADLLDEVNATWAKKLDEEFERMRKHPGWGDGKYFDPFPEDEAKKLDLSTSDPDPSISPIPHGDNASE